MNLERKVDFAIKLLQSIPTNDGPIELSYSGGKDSDVILELARMSGIPFEAIYKNTTIDPPGTIAHCKEQGVTIVNPKISFLKLVEKRVHRQGLRVSVARPSRNTRFITGQFKASAARNQQPARKDTANPKYVGFIRRKKRSAFICLYLNGRTRTLPDL